MVKGLKKLLIVSLVVLCAFVISACAGGTKKGTALKQTYDELKSAEKDAKGKPKGNSIAEYNSKNDTLYINLKGYENYDAIFKLLNKNIKNKDIGTLVFDCYYGVTDLGKRKIINNIGKLQCNSMKVLALDETLYQYGNHSWINVLDKVDALYTDNLSVFAEYTGANKQKLASVKKLWLKESYFYNIDVFSGIEELGIYATVEENDNRMSVEETLSTGETLPTTKEAPTKKNGETVKVEPNRSVFIFNKRNYQVDVIKKLKKVPKLKKLTIAPCFDRYIFDDSGADYIFAVSNVRSDLLVNLPEVKLSDNRYESIESINKINATRIEGSREAIVSQFINDEVPGLYKKAKKFKTKSKKAKLKGKALVYMATPSNSFATKKKFYTSGRVLNSKELGRSIKCPQKSGDYRYFVYAYPTHKRAGKYNKGTKAYSETYYVQVVDLNKKITYKPLKVATAKPEKKLKYWGTPPSKHSGSVKEKKVIRFIKKLR